MKWRREINYHGSRIYAPDPDPEDQVFHRLMSWARRPFERLFRAVFQSSTASLNPLDDEGFYSLLGTGRKQGAPARAAKAACPFPQDGSGQGQIIRHRNQANDR